MTRPDRKLLTVRDVLETAIGEVLGFVVIGGYEVAGMVVDTWGRLVERRNTRFANETHEGEL